ncbi:jg11570 [Pararge aegeria aegeria]|uniref:Jg11570 protein n=1 Tax=Pararge aegeria aegeria TaxID=348720 RepID=A0A8S4SE58_9NEOP|nr:jg11570 [Pararge aegeria aegeria]
MKDLQVTSVLTLANICASLSLVYRSTAQRDCMGSMIFSLLLAANANLVVLEYSSMVRRKACWAPSVMLSASSRITILCLPGGNVT